MTAVTRPVKPPPITEAEFMRQVTDLALMFGYGWAHFRPAQTSRGWRTPVSGPLGAGFPDLVLVRAATPSREGRVIFAELKRAGGRLSPEQAGVQHALGQAGAEAYVWWPEDFEQIAAVLR